MRDQGILLLLTTFAGLASGAVTEVAKAAPVELMSARYHGNEDMGAPFVTGSIEVENLAYEKQVVIHYRYQEEAPFTEWMSVPATYAGTLPGGNERWVFETERAPSYYRGANFELYVEYIVRGEIFRDDARGENYALGSGYLGSRYMWGVLGNQSVLVLGASMDRPYRGRVAVLVKDLGADKHVTIVYSPDHWQTTHTVEAEYQYAFGAHGESWAAGVELDDSTGTFELAVRYTVNGETYWDDNFGQNYTARFAL